MGWRGFFNWRWWASGWLGFRIRRYVWCARWDIRRNGLRRSSHRNRWIRECIQKCALRKRGFMNFRKHLSSSFFRIFVADMTLPIARSAAPSACFLRSHLYCCLPLPVTSLAISWTLPTNCLVAPLICFLFIIGSSSSWRRWPNKSRSPSFSCKCSHA